jgi:hypothetical protein
MTMKRKNINYKDKTLQYIKKLDKVITWILEGFILPDSGSRKLYIPLLNQLERVYSTRGEAGLISYTKSLRTSLLNYLSGNLVKVKGVRITKDGIPRVLVPLILESSYGKFPASRLQIILTILFSTRGLKLGRIADLTPIISPGETLPENIGKYSHSFWKELGYRSNTQKVPRSLNFKSYHFTTKAGPNGHALAKSLCDLYSLPIDLIESIKIVGGKVISDRIDCLLESRHTINKFMDQSEGKYRKIVSFPDKEYKVRVVAILDYWSQTVLKPLHTYLMNVLKKIKQDATYNQGSFKESMKGCEIYYSVDLTAATDRFPITLIAQVLKGFLPSLYVDN